MKHIFCLGLALALSLSALAADPSDDAKKFRGTWKPAKAELAGQAIPEVVLKSIGGLKSPATCSLSNK